MGCSKAGVFFALTPLDLDPLDSKNGSFVYSVLFENAVEILTMDWNMFLKYGDRLGEPANMDVILLSSIGE